jgi:hypothetical protein
VVGYVDGRRALETHYRFHTLASLRGMIAHDLAHVSLGLGFEVQDEAQIREARQDLRQLERVARATSRILEGKNVVLR